MSKRILIVEDDQALLMFLRNKLEKEGFEIDEATSGGQITEKVEKNSYDLILMDYQIPDMMGDEVCSIIRENDNKKNLPIIMMSASSLRGEQFFKDAGATEVLFKPLDIDDLMTKMMKCLGG